MKGIAIVCVHNEDKFLTLWLKYYSSQLDSLHVVNHLSDDGSVENAQKSFKFNVSNTDWPLFDSTTNVLMMQELIALSKLYLATFDFVVVSDSDEFIIPDPDKYKGIKDYVKKNNRDYSICSAWNVDQVHEEKNLDWKNPVLGQRKYWSRNPRYCKALVFKKIPNWTIGHHRIEGITEENYMKMVDEDLVLAHLGGIDANLVRKNQRFSSISVNEKMEIIPSKYKIL